MIDYSHLFLSLRQEKERAARIYQSVDKGGKEMKYLILLGDGMADYKMAELGDKTVLQYSNTPNMDFLAANGELGLVKTVPDGFKPASDVANLSAMGYDPRICYSGRSPLEAFSLGIMMKDTDVSMRTNLVTLSEEEDFRSKRILDHSSGEISSEEAAELIEEVNKYLADDLMHFYPGVSYRHILLWHEGHLTNEFTPPHDILGKTIGDYLPRGEDGEMLSAMMEKSYEILNDHPVNQARRAKGLNPANSIWFWGEGSKPSIEDFSERYGLKGSVVAAVDLIQGIGKCADMRVVKVEGATGGVVTNFRGKAEAAFNELKNGQDFVYIHVEAPDESGHSGVTKYKINAIESIDHDMLGFLLPAMEDAFEEYSIMLLPDHATPLSLRTHSREPVPFAVYRKGDKNNERRTYCEEDAAATGVYYGSGVELMRHFLQK